MFIAVDCETSGLVQFKMPSEHPDQPFIVTLAIIELNSETLIERAAHHFLLRPPLGRVIPEEITKIHGITTERALDEGNPAEEALSLYASMRRQCTGSVAHNAPFDLRMLRIEFLRAGKTKEWIDELEASSKQFCTQTIATPVLRLPPTEKMKRAGFNRPKSPNLAEAYRMLCGGEFDDAHGALEDARVCAKVFKVLRDEGHVTL